MIRSVLRKEAVLAATGWANSTLYQKIADGKFPPGTKLDPDGRAVVWFSDEVAAIQEAAAALRISSVPKKAIARQTTETVSIKRD